MIMDEGGPAKSAERYRKERELWALLHQTSHAIERAREQEISQLGISMMQAAVMWVIRTAEPPVTPTKIARWLFRRPNTVSALLDRMEKRGLVRRVNTPHGRSMKELQLTDKGEELRRKSIEHMRVVDNIMSSLSDEEVGILITALQKLRARSFAELAAIREMPYP
jgi:DNA-binding MarR family transcriptional regulator